MNIAIASRLAGLAAFFVAAAFFIAGVAGVPAHAAPAPTATQFVLNCGQFRHPILTSPTKWGCSEADDALHRHRHTLHEEHNKDEHHNR
jgi:hypothetical protein